MPVARQSCAANSPITDINTGNDSQKSLSSHVRRIEATKQLGATAQRDVISDNLRFYMTYNYEQRRLPYTRANMNNIVEQSLHAVRL